MERERIRRSELRESLVQTYVFKGREYLIETTMTCGMTRVENGAMRQRESDECHYAKTIKDGWKAWVILGVCKVKTPKIK